MGFPAERIYCCDGFVDRACAGRDKRAEQAGLEHMGPIVSCAGLEFTTVDGACERGSETLPNPGSVGGGALGNVGIAR